MEITQSGKQTKSQILKNESNIWGWLENIKHANQGIIWIPEGEERERGIRNVLDEIMDENLNKKTDIQVQEKQVVTRKISPNRLYQDIL